MSKTYFSSKSSNKINNISKRNNYSQGKYSFKFLNNEMKYSLPKITPISLLMTENNKSSKRELLCYNNNENGIESYRKKTFNIIKIYLMLYKMN